MREKFLVFLHFSITFQSKYSKLYILFNTTWCLLGGYIYYIAFTQKKKKKKEKGRLLMRTGERTHTRSRHPAFLRLLWWLVQCADAKAKASEDKDEMEAEIVY